MKPVKKMNVPFNKQQNIISLKLSLLIFGCTAYILHIYCIYTQTVIVVYKNKSFEEKRSVRATHFY